MGVPARELFAPSKGKTRDPPPLPPAESAATTESRGRGVRAFRCSSPASMETRAAPSGRQASSETPSLEIADPKTFSCWEIELGNVSPPCAIPVRARDCALCLEEKAEEDKLRFEAEVMEEEQLRCEEEELRCESEAEEEEELLRESDAEEGLSCNSECLERWTTASRPCDDGSEVVDSAACTLRCLGCSRQSTWVLCDRCIAQVKKNLLGTNLLIAAHSVEGSGELNFCFVCGKITRGSHGHTMVQLDWFRSKLVAWVTAWEKCAPIFKGIQSDCCYYPVAGRPFLLHPPKGRRCKACLGMAGRDTMLSSVDYCSLLCWFDRGGSAGYIWAATLVGRGGDDKLDYVHGSSKAPMLYCIACVCFIHAESVQEHVGHDHLHMVSIRGETMCVKLPREHHVSKIWTSVLEISDDDESQFMLFALHPNKAMRCRKCQLHLDDGGGRTCSLECCLELPRYIPRPLLLPFR